MTRIRLITHHGRFFNDFVIFLFFQQEVCYPCPVMFRSF